MVPFNKSWYVQVLDFLQMIYVLELTQSITTDRDTSIVALISLGRATQDIVGFTDSRSAPHVHCMKEGVKSLNFHSTPGRSFIVGVEALSTLFAYPTGINHSLKQDTRTVFRVPCVSI